MAKILVIDDDDEIRTMVREMLLRTGHDVTEARNGASGLTEFEKAMPDLVITDIIMPEMEGAETIIHIRSHCPDTKIIAISGGSESLKASVCLRVAEVAGACVMLEKPISRSKLLKAVHELLQD